MKTITKILGFLILTLTGAGAEAHADHQVKHNMLMLGESEIFISHIVYKQPHNYQVILKMDFEESVRNTYLEEKKKYPDQEFIFFLDKMCIADIESADSIQGVMFRRDADGNKTILFDTVKVVKSRYKIVFFNELPLNLGTQ